MADLSKIKLNGTEYDLKDNFAREAIANIPEDKIFPVKITLTSTTEGTSNKTHDEIAAAVNAGKIPFVYINYSGIKMIAPLTRVESNYSVFTYEDQTVPDHANYACLKIQNSTATVTWRDQYTTFYDLSNYLATYNYITSNYLENNNYITSNYLGDNNYITSDNISSYETDPMFTTSAAANITSEDIVYWNAKSDFSGSYNDLTDQPTIPNVPAWALEENKPTYTAGEVGALPDTTVIPAAQVQSDWNATSGMGVILNKPNLSTFMVKGTDYVTAGQKSGTTLGNKATAEGTNTTASGIFSHAEGFSTTASGNYSHAEGFSTTASEGRSHAEGQNTTASGTSSHAEGGETTASGSRSHAEGQNTTASGTSSHAEGGDTTASGNYSHAEGFSTTAQRESQHVFGEYNIADTGSASSRGTYVEIVGNGRTSSTRSNARTLDWSGNEVLAGKLTIGTAPTANMDVTTKQYVDNAITTAIGGINQFEVAIVTNLPTANIDAHTIYFKSNSSSGNNVYDEYIYINNNWELIGSTQVDLSNYLQTSDIAAWAKAANKPTYTATEVGALPDTTVIPAAQVNSDWNATSGIAQILNKPSIPEAELDSNVEDMLDSFNLDYTSNTTNSNYANGVSF